MKLDVVYNRFDDEVFQQILSKELISTLRLIDSKKIYHDDLFKILKSTYSDYELLQSKFTRDLIIDVLHPSEVIILVGLFDLNLDKSQSQFDFLKNINYNSNNLKKLYLFFELPELEKIENKIEYSKLVSPNYKLFSYQNNVLLDVDKYLNSEFNRVLLHMPTGAGKTRTAMAYCSNFLNKNRNCHVIWLANTIELIDQAYDEFEKAWSSLGNRELKLIKYYDEADETLLEIKEAFVVCGIDKMLNYYKKSVSKFSAFSAKCKLVVFDEAHMVVAENYKILTQSLIVINKANFIGLSATPGRSWADKNKDAELADFFKKQKAVIKIDGYDNPVRYLEDNGYLAKIKNTPLYSSSGNNLTPADFLYLKNNSKLPERILNSISEDSARNVIIIQKAVELVKVHKRILLFSINVKHAKVLNGLLISMGIKSFLLTSSTDSELRSDVIKKYKTPIKDDPTPMIICNYGILTTGFDAPETSCAIIARPTDSLVLYSQMVGRATRGVNSKGNEEAEIVTVIDTQLQGFKETAEAFFNWEDVWE